MQRAEWVKSALLAIALSGIVVLPARADSITIDSTNCSTATACYGLSWTLTVNTGAFTFGGQSYGYQVLLQVADDALLSGTPSVVISAVDFKVSDSVSSAALYTFPSLSSSGWTTYTNVLNSGGCTGANAGFVCSQTTTDPANFIASGTPQTWGWYFNTSSSLFAGLAGAHIGAKMTDLSRPGRLLSQSYSVPEPSSLAALVMGIGMAMTAFRRRRRR